MEAISDKPTTKIAYFAIFEPDIRIDITVWGGTTQNSLRFLRLQKKAVRVLNCLRENFKNFKIVMAIALYIQEIIKHVDRKNHYDYNTRNASDYSLPAHHLTLYKKKPAYIGKKLYDLLPATLKCLTGWNKADNSLN